MKKNTLPLQRQRRLRQCHPRRGRSSGRQKNKKVLRRSGIKKETAQHRLQELWLDELNKLVPY